ncbi:MAG TPA: glycosyltransferase, partial [Acidimicrobiia bacterium]|nr:glycosyltransferase [Acidimicrobiia bacterium]
MIRLLSVQPVAERGGSDHLLVRMLRSLPPDEFDCHVALPGRSPLAEEFAAAGASLHTVPMERLSTSHGAGKWAGYVAGWPVAVARLVRLIRRLQIDVVHSNSLHSLYGWAAAAITGRPHIWQAREIVVQSGAAMQLERFLARHFAVKVVCMSQAVAAQLDPANVEV